MIFLIVGIIKGAAFLGAGTVFLGLIGAWLEYKDSKRHPGNIFPRKVKYKGYVSRDGKVLMFRASIDESYLSCTYGLNRVPTLDCMVKEKKL